MSPRPSPTRRPFFELFNVRFDGVIFRSSGAGKQRTNYYQRKLGRLSKAVLMICAFTTASIVTLPSRRLTGASDAVDIRAGKNHRGGQDASGCWNGVLRGERSTKDPRVFREKGQQPTVLCVLLSVWEPFNSQTEGSRSDRIQFAHIDQFFFILAAHRQILGLPSCIVGHSKINPPS